MATPKVTRTLYDNNLDRSVPQGPTNRRVVILGTASDGPMYEPLLVNSPANAEDLFGSFGSGTLVRGLKECINAQASSTASPDTWGMRIGDTNAQRASASLVDGDGAEVMQVESIYKADLYNQVTIKKDADALGNQWIYVYNPKTGLSSKFDSALDADELASAINADPNTKDMLFAVSATAGNAENLELTAAAGSYDATADVLIVDVQTDAAGATASWPVAEISKVYTVGASELKTLEGSTVLAVDAGTSIAEAPASIGNDTQPDYAPIMLEDNINDSTKKNYVYYTGTIEADFDALADGLTFDEDFDLGADILGAADVNIAGTVTVTDKSGVVGPLELAAHLLIVDTDVATFSLDTDLSLFNGKNITVSVEFTTVANPKLLTNVGMATVPTTEFQYRLSTSANLALTFGAIPTYTMNLRYAQKVQYESPNGYSESSGIVTVSTSYLTAIAKAIIGMEYFYSAGTPVWTSTYQLSAGRDGILMTNAQLKADLVSAYEHFHYDFFDIMCVTDLTVDALLADGSSAGFAEQMSAFLNTFNGEMLAVIGYEPLVGSGIGGRIERLADISHSSTGRVSQLTQEGLSGYNDANAGTILPSINQPFMFAPDLEPIFSSNGVRYSAISTSAVAGLIAVMPTEEAIYRHPLSGALGLRYRYTEKDQASGERQVDILANARIPVGTIDSGAVKLTDSKTLAAPGSDFENLMTVLILQETLDICREVAKDFKGLVTSNALLQAMQSAMDKKLGDALVPRVLRGFKAPILLTPGERVVGKLTIPLTLSPQFELRDVHFNLQLTADDLV